MNTDLLIVAGGVGLFLVGMTILVEGLSGAVGAMIRRVLATWTSTPTTGAVFGALTTAIVQSSSVTTVTAVGFVSAGLLTFPQALGILFGANIGTTITGWVVAIVGFKLHLGHAAMPLILVGIAMRLFGAERLRHIGWALVGFALLFVGIDAMTEGMAQYQGILTPASFPPDTIFGRLQLVCLGIAITIVTQSSSAGVAAALVALNTETISLAQAAAMVIGMNVGTTFSAALATLGASVSTRRTGYSHVIFNALTGLFALILLGPFLFIAQPYVAAGDPGNSQVALVAFHSLFNFLGVVLVLPFANTFARLIIRLVPERDPTLVRRLDQRLLAEPASAIVAAGATIRDLTQLVAKTTAVLIADGRLSQASSARTNAVAQAIETTRSFIDQVQPGQSEPDVRDRKIAALHALDHLNRLAHRCRQASRIEKLDADQRLRRLSRITTSQLDRLARDDHETSRQRLNRLRAMLREQRHTYREHCIETGISGGLATKDVLERLDSLRWLHRVAYHFWRLSHHVPIAEQTNGITRANDEARIDVEED